MEPYRIYGALYGVWGPLACMGPLSCVCHNSVCDVILAHMPEVLSRLAQFFGTKHN